MLRLTSSWSRLGDLQCAQLLGLGCYCATNNWHGGDLAIEQVSVCLFGRPRTASWWLAKAWQVLVRAKCRAEGEGRAEDEGESEGEDEGKDEDEEQNEGAGECSRVGRQEVEMTTQRQPDRHTRCATSSRGSQ